MKKKKEIEVGEELDNVFDGFKGDVRKDAFDEIVDLLEEVQTSWPDRESEEYNEGCEDTIMRIKQMLLELE